MRNVTALTEQGVVVAVTSLVMTVAQDHLDAFAVCYQKAVDRLDKVRRLRSAPLTAQIVVKQDYPSDYVYYKVPVPWLQVKLLRLLQYYPPSGPSRSFVPR